MNRRNWMHVLVLAGLNFSALAAEQELCEVGVTAISSSLTNTIVAVSYDDLGGSDMVVSNLVKTTNLTVGDKLAVFNNSKTYDTWVLAAGTGGAKYWAKQDKTYTVDGNGQLTVNTGVDAATTFLGVGTGFWLTRQNPTQGGSAVPFYLYGKPASAKSVTVPADSWALVGNPTQNPVTIGKDWVAASNNDQLVLFGTNGKLWYYTYREGKGWRTTDEKGEWDYTAPVIGAGLGFWIRLANGTTINW